MNRPTKLAKHTPFRDRNLHTEASQHNPTSQKARQFRFVNNENLDSSNPVMYMSDKLSEIKRKSRPSDTCEFECREDYNTADEQIDEVKRSMNLNPRDRSHSQDNMLKLTQSQEVVFRRPDRNAPINSSLTFASIKQGALKNSLSSNQEFMEDKKMKNEILEEIIKKASQKNLKSQEFARKSQRMDMNSLCCANQDGKKVERKLLQAKYRIISESDSEEDLYYCSKCSIMLLQQGFNVVEIGPTKKNELSRRRKDCEAMLGKVSDFQGRLKYHMNQLECEQAGMFEQARRRMEETYDIIMFIVEQMKARDVEAMNQSEQKMTLQKKKQRAKLADKFRQLQSMREQLNHLIDQGMVGVTEEQLNSALNGYADTLSNFERYEPLTFQLKEEPLQEKLERLINEVNEHYTARRSQFSFQSQPESSPSDIGTDSTKKPFRGLFTDEQPQSSMHRKKNSRYYNGEFIQEEDENFSPNFKKHY